MTWHEARKFSTIFQLLYLITVIWSNSSHHLSILSGAGSLTWHLLQKSRFFFLLLPADIPTIITSNATKNFLKSKKLSPHYSSIFNSKKVQLRCWWEFDLSSADFSMFCPSSPPASPAVQTSHMTQDKYASCLSRAEGTQLTFYFRWHGHSWSSQNGQERC